MEPSVLLVGGDRRQTILAELARKLGIVETLSVPGCPDTAREEPPALLILPCPAADRSGRIRCAGEGLAPEQLLPFLSPETQVFGGAFGSLRSFLDGKACTVTDLLEDPLIAAQNARLTAEAALLLVRTETEASLLGVSAAVLGWGRIAKCLAALLRANGASVLVCARRAEALAEAAALGFRSCPLAAYPGGDALIFNTIPARIPNPERFASDRCLWVELASAPGGLPDPPPLPVLNGSGLPGRLLPRSASEVLFRGIQNHLR